MGNIILPGVDTQSARFLGKSKKGTYSQVVW